MLPKVIAAKTSPDHTLSLDFSDGTSGMVDVTKLVSFTNIFAPLADPAFFQQGHADAKIGTVEWPNGADLDPLVLHAIANGRITEAEYAATRRLPDFEVALNSGYYDETVSEISEVRETWEDQP